MDRLAAVAGAGRFTITADAVDRGEVASSQAGSTQQWVADRCPSLDARDAGLVAKAVRELTDPSGAGQASALAGARVGGAGGPAVGVRRLCGRVRAAAADPAAGAGRGRRGRRRAGRDGGGRRRRPGSAGSGPPCWPGTASAMRLQDLEDRHRGLTVLPVGTTSAAGSPSTGCGSTPKPAPSSKPPSTSCLERRARLDGRDADPRTIDQRRGDALVQVCRRAVASTDPTATATGTDDRRADGSTAAASRRREGHRPGHHRPGRPKRPDPTRRPGRRRRRRHPPRPGDRPPAGLRRHRHPARPRRRRAHPALGTRPAVLHHRPDHSPVAPRPALHLPRLPTPRHLVRRPPPPALARRRTHRPDQRRPALRTAPHHRPPRPPHTPPSPPPTPATPHDTGTGVRVVWDRTPGSYDRALARGPSPGATHHHPVRRPEP